MSYEKCFAGLRQAAGRDLSDAEISNIFESLHKSARDIKAGRVDVADVELPDPRAFKKPMEGNLLFEMAAERAAKELVHKAEVQARRGKLQIARLAARKAEFDALTHQLDGIESVKNLIARDYSGRTNIQSLEQLHAGYRSYFHSKLLPAWDALGNDFLGFFQNRGKMLDLIKELRGEDSGNALAKKGAKAFHEVADEARKVFNENGGDIGHLDNWGHPQHHSQLKVADAAYYLTGTRSENPAVNRQAWVDFMMPLMSKTRDGGKFYVDDLGRQFTDVDLRRFLEKAWDNIATDGHASAEPGVRGGASRARRHAESRQIHFPDAESTIKYWELFGDRSLVEILHGHVDTLAKDIAFVEYFGPNPDVTYRTLRDLAVQKMTSDAPRKTEQIEGRAHRLDDLYNYAAGKTKPSANTAVSNIADGIASLNVSGKLGGAVLASFFGDKPMMEAVSHLNDLPMVQRWGNELRLLNPANSVERALLQQNGLMLDGIRSGLNRFYEGLGGGGAGPAGSFKNGTGKIANAVMRISGMNAINEIRKGAFGLSLMAAIGRQIRGGVDFGALHKSDIRTLRNYGITKADWQVWQLAKLDDLGHGNDAVLTPEAIGRIPDAQMKQTFGAKADPAAIRRHAIVKLLGAVNTESDFAIITPGWRERAQFYGDLQRGTVKGEIARSVLQFKSFPWAAFKRGMDAVANANGPVGKAAMVAFLVSSTTLAGAMLNQVHDLLAGKDPRPMNDENSWKFWGAAFLRGGALGIYGDFLYGANHTRYGSGILETVSGPSLGPLLEMGLVLPMNAASAAIEGKDTHLAAQIMQRVKGFTPTGNLWYSKTAIDHLIWQNVFETLSPGYLRNIEKRTAKEYGQDWWWRPGEFSPERTPDFAAAID